MLKTFCLLFCLCVTALAQSTPQATPTPKPTPAPEVKVVETATLTADEVKEGKAIYSLLNSLNQRGQLAQKIIDQPGNSSEAVLLAYRERDRVLEELKAHEDKNRKWVARVQSRTGCIDCGYFDFEKGIIQKSPPEQK